MFVQTNTIHAAGSMFVEGAYTPSVSLEILGNVRSAKQREWEKQMKKMLRN
jgi:hypothetical protein